MGYDRELQAARAAVEAEERARTAWEAALAARDERVRALFRAAADEISQNDMARRVGLTGSTLRAITADLRRARRTRTQTR